MKPRTRIVLGPPGTGKTSYLMQMVEDALEQKYEPEQIAFLTFSKKAAQVAIERAVLRFGFDRTRFKYFRTIHSFAYHGHRIVSSEVMQKNHYMDFGQRWGYTFSNHGAEYVRGFSLNPRYGSGTGDQLLKCYDLARARGIPVTDEAERGEYLFSQYMVDQFVQRFEAYKAQNELVTFNDFLDQPVDVPEVRILMIDEAQDLTPHQWRFIRATFREVPDVWIAGDDDQCIYDWNGADLNFFLNVEGEIIILHDSRRVPRSHHHLATGITRLIEHRYDKPWVPKKEEGALYYAHSLEEINFEEDREILVLGRRSKEVRAVYRMLKNLGINFKFRGMWRHEEVWFQAILAYQEIAQGEPITQKKGRHIAKFLTSFLCPSPESKGKDRLFWEDFHSELVGRPPWYEICDKITYRQVDFAKAVIAKDFPMNVTVSTIHGVKGDEADHVVLLDKLMGRPKENFLKNPDSERRVWYVGCTRARQSLVICGSGRNSIIR